MVLCLICGASVNLNETRALPANRQCLGILLSSLMIFDHADVNEMREVYALGGRRNKQLCKGHHAKAVSHMYLFTFVFFTSNYFFTMESAFRPISFSMKWKNVVDCLAIGIQMRTVESLM